MGVLWRRPKKKRNGNHSNQVQNCVTKTTFVTVTFIFAIFILSSTVHFVSAPKSTSKSLQQFRRYAAKPTPTSTASKTPVPVHPPSDLVRHFPLPLSVPANDHVSPSPQARFVSPSPYDSSTSTETHHWQRLTNQKIVHSFDDGRHYSPATVHQVVSNAPMTVYFLPSQSPEHMHMATATSTVAPAPELNRLQPGSAVHPNLATDSSDTSWKLVPTISPTVAPIPDVLPLTATTPTVMKLPATSDRIKAVHWGSSGMATTPAIRFSTPTIIRAASAQRKPNNQLPVSEQSLVTSSPIIVKDKSRHPTDHAFLSSLVSTSPSPISSIWYKPIINQYIPTTPLSSPALRLPSLSKVNADAAPSPHEPTGLDDTDIGVPDASITFKIWSYDKDNKGLHLHGEKQISSKVLSGFNMSDGAIINLNQIPGSLRQLVTNAITKRLGEPPATGSDAHHWQKLPAIVPGKATPVATVGAVRPRPTKLNYVVWSTSTTTPRPNPFLGVRRPARPFSDPHPYPGSALPTMSPPPCDEYQKQLELYLQNFVKTSTTTTSAPLPFPMSPIQDDGWALVHDFMQKQMTTSSPSSSTEDGVSSNLPSDSVFTNALALQWLLSQMGDRYTGAGFPQSPTVPTTPEIRPGFSAPSDLDKLRPPHRDPFWAYLNPVFQHLLNKKDRISNQKQALLNAFGLGAFNRPAADNSGIYTNDFGALTSPASFISFTESHLGQNANHRNPYIPDYENYDYEADSDDFLKKAAKKAKKRRKKAKKKRKKGKKGGWKSDHHWALFDPSKFNFNFNFGFDIYDLIKQKFLALLALKLTPLILLTFFVVVPFGLIALAPLVMKGLNYFHVLRNKFKLYNPFNRVRQGVGSGLARPTTAGWQPMHYNGYGHGPGAVADTQQEFHHHYYDYAAGSGPTHELFGAYTNDYPSPGLKLDRVLNPNYLAAAAEEEAVSASPLSSPATQSELDTQYNREVMEILMNGRNATIENLLAKWGLHDETQTQWIWGNKTKTGGA